MTGAVLNLLVNVAIVVLLCVTIAYCWVLNRRIKILQDSRSELAQLLTHFDESTQRASESIIALQTASKKIGENIQMRIEKANYLIDDLAFMLERGNKLANQLEANFAVNRARNRVESEAHDDPPARETEPAAKTARPASNEKARSTLEAVLERLAVRNKSMLPEETEDDSQRQARARSRSEQELMAMLKAGIKG
jgi:hypothetical protein